MDQEQFRKKYHYYESTQVMQQYLDIKFSNIDCFVLFRMGDFYELFYEDAVTASFILGIALTKRSKTQDQEIAMCGVPYHALETYLNKLLENNIKVAICDQIETPEEAKKKRGYKAVVKREVIRIITPGTVLEESLIESGKPNYLASVVLDKNQAAICYVDLSISDIYVILIPKKELLNELVRISPKEILLSDRYKSSEFVNSIIQEIVTHISFQVDSIFADRKCKKIILEFYKINSISSIGELSLLHISAIGSMIDYLLLTQKKYLSTLPKPKVIHYSDLMHIDAATRRNLELFVSLKGNVKGSLFYCIDKTISKAGSRLLYKFLSAPLISIEKINNRLNITEFFYKNIDVVEKIRLKIKKTGDIERCITKLNSSRSTAKDLLIIKNTIINAESIKEELISLLGVNIPKYIDDLTKPLLGHNYVYKLIEDSIREDAPALISGGNIIKLDYHPRIKELHKLINDSKAFIESLKQQYRNETSIDTLKISYNNVLGLFIDITSRHSSKVLDKKFIHRQSTTNSVRYITKELKELESKMINAQQTSINLEKEIYNNICQEIILSYSKLLSLAKAIAYIDLFCTFAFIAHERGYHRPHINNERIFHVQEGRNPIVEQYLINSNKVFITNDCQLSANERVWLITGPNMAGKSTFLRQNALIAILSHIGSFVPASVSNIGIIDKIFSRIGAGDDLTKGQSTFMLEMVETSAILAQSTDKSLIILDEVGRGTSTYDGVAIAWSVLEYIHDRLKARCLFATHYHELTAISDTRKGIKNYTAIIEEDNNNLLFLYKIIKGFSDRSYGIYIAKMAGLPQSIIDRAYDLLANLEQNLVSKE